MNETDWIDICDSSDIMPNAGRCALINGAQVAIFRVSQPGVQDSSNDSWYALDNCDPFSQANVLSRGLVGNLADRVVVASPIYKQHFCLQTGVCLEDNTTRLKTYAVRLHNNRIQLSA